VDEGRERQQGSDLARPRPSLPNPYAPLLVGAIPRDLLLENLQGEALLQLHPRGIENRADGACRSALLADDLPQV